MNWIMRGILTAALVFIGTLILGYFISGKINWILSAEIASGSLIGILLRYRWSRDARKLKESGD